MISFLQYLRKTKELNNGLSNISLFGHWKIYKEWKRLFESKEFPLHFELPWVTIVSKNFLRNFLETKDKSQTKVFEFGSGGSSLFFLKYASEVVTVEHDKSWFNLVEKTISERKIEGWFGNLFEAEKVDNDKLDKSEPLDYYTDDENFKGYQFKKYASHISNYPDNYFDIVLVDGRSRPSCLYHSFSKVKKDGLLVLDNAERDYYFTSQKISEEEFELILDANSALICAGIFTKTNIYRKKK